jgi:uncharacterized membrane protein YsdA (DUF1294 family)
VKLFVASARNYFVLQHTIDKRKDDKEGDRIKEKMFQIFFFLEKGTGNRARIVLQ